MNSGSSEAKIVSNKSNLTKQLEVPPNGIYGNSTTNYNKIHYYFTHNIRYSNISSAVKELSLDGFRNTNLKSNCLDGVSAMNMFGHLLW